MGKGALPVAQPPGFEEEIIVIEGKEFNLAGMSAEDKADIHAKMDKLNQTMDNHMAALRRGLMKCEHCGRVIKFTVDGGAITLGRVEYELSRGREPKAIHDYQPKYDAAPRVEECSRPILPHGALVSMNITDQKTLDLLGVGAGDLWVGWAELERRMESESWVECQSYYKYYLGDIRHPPEATPETMICSGSEFCSRRICKGCDKNYPVCAACARAEIKPGGHPKSGEGSDGLA